MITLAGMEIWDVHHHWVNEVGYIDRLLRQMDRLNIARTGLIAMGAIVQRLFLRHEATPHAFGNEDLARLLKQHPDRFWGYGYLRLGQCQSGDVDRLVDMGITALKFHIPLKPYSAEEYFPVYARAAHYRLPCLFHTGVFYPPAPMPGAGIRSENYRPIHLEPMTHEFPELPIVAAHLGVCWNDEALALARICASFHVDLSGRADGWRRLRPLSWFQQNFAWEGAHRKVLFGSDVHADELSETCADQIRIFQGIGWTNSQLADVLAGNAKRIFGGGQGASMR